MSALVLMHFLGGSGREWDEVIGACWGMSSDRRGRHAGLWRVSATVPGYSVEQMADAVEYLVGSLRAGTLCAGGPQYVRQSRGGGGAAVCGSRQGIGFRRHGTGSGTIHAERLDGLEGLILIAPIAS